MASQPGHTCDLCGSPDVVVGFGIALDMGGYDYWICSPCLDETTLGEFLEFARDDKEALEAQ